MIRLSHPKLHHHIGLQFDTDRNFLWLYDSYRLSTQAIKISRSALPLLQKLDGTLSLIDLKNEWERMAPGFVTGGHAEKFLDSLEAAALLPGLPYDKLLATFRAASTRPSSSAGGTYSNDPKEIDEQMQELYLAEEGPGLPIVGSRINEPIRGALIPHMDYGRGGVTYGHGFKEVLERANADFFVCIATSHHSPSRFILTKKDFETPLGLVKTDQQYVDTLLKHYGEEAIEDEAAHLPEHSIELHLIPLLHGLMGKKEFKIVPLLVGSFDDLLRKNQRPETHPEVSRMVAALKLAEKEASGRICYLISGDMAHIGPKFGDEELVDDTQLSLSRERDSEIAQELLKKAGGNFFDTILKERNARRWCGFSPLQTFLATAEPKRGDLKHYQQFVASNGSESVSFASVIFE